MKQQIGEHEIEELEMEENQRTANGMCVTFWGTRGSGAVAGKEYVIYGGNSSCVSVENREHLFVFDAGTGIGQLGHCLKKKNFAGEIHLFLSHLHLDHIQGLPLCPLVFQPSITLHLYGEARLEGSLRKYLNLVLAPPFWPVSPEQYGAKLIWHDLDEKKGGPAAGGDGWRVKVLSAVHPNSGVVYRLETEAGSVLYGLDTEMPESYVDRFAAFARDVDLLIFDGAYDDAEYPQVKGFGHGTWQQAADMAKRSGAGRVLVSHHKWERTDEELRVLEEQAHRMDSRISFAKEGMQIIV